jgi:hypothetical protein
MLVGEFQRISEAKKTTLHYSRLFAHLFKNSWISAKRLTPTGYHMQLVKQVAIASLKKFWNYR